MKNNSCEVSSNYLDYSYITQWIYILSISLLGIIYIAIAPLL